MTTLHCARTSKIPRFLQMTTNLYIVRNSTSDIGEDRTDGHKDAMITCVVYPTLIDLSNGRRSLLGREKTCGMGIVSNRHGSKSEPIRSSIFCKKGKEQAMVWSFLCNAHFWQSYASRFVPFII